MPHLDISFRDFVKNQLIAETKKESRNDKQAPEPTKKEISYDWIKQIQEEFTQITKQYDNL